MIGARTRWGVVIGDPVEHSLSPAIQNAAFAAAGIDAVFLAMRVAPTDLDAALAFVRAQRPIGVSVTVPHKQAVAERVDELVAPADRIGAVNCLVVRDGRLVGYNTDAPGFADAVGDVAGRRAVVLGAGGAARAVCSGLTDAGASVTVVARSPERVAWIDAQPWTAGSLAALAPRCDVLVDCTSTGLEPAREAGLPAAIPIDALPADALVASLVYHREPALLARARARGLRTLDGAAMLVHQGARAFSLWTGRPAPIDVMFRSIERPS